MENSNEVIKAKVFFHFDGEPKASTTIHHRLKDYFLSFDHQISTEFKIGSIVVFEKRNHIIEDIAVRVYTKTYSNDKGIDRTVPDGLQEEEANPFNIAIDVFLKKP